LPASVLLSRFVVPLLFRYRPPPRPSPPSPPSPVLLPLSWLSLPWTSLSPLGVVPTPTAPPLAPSPPVARLPETVEFDSVNDPAWTITPPPRPQLPLPALPPPPRTPVSSSLLPSPPLPPTPPSPPSTVLE